MVVHVGYARGVLAYLRQQGEDPAAIVRPDLLHRIEHADTHTDLPLADFERLLAAAKDGLDDTEVAIKASEFVQSWEGGVLGFALMTSPTISEVGNLLVRFQRLLTSVYELTSRLDDDGFELRLSPTGAARAPGLARMLMGAWAWRARWFTGEPSLRFDASFEDPVPRDLAAYQRCFGGTVRFGQPATAMRGSAECLALPVRQHDPSVNGLLRAQAAVEMERVAGDAASLLVVLRRRLRERLGGGALTLDALAADVDMAPRTLQVRLEAQGVTFRALLDGVRDRKAKQYLEASQLNLTEIALALGFANQSAFQHAFKRWTGVTPGEWRRQQGRR